MSLRRGGLDGLTLDSMGYFSGGGGGGSTLKTNLKAFWDLSEASGTRNDSTANAINLTDNNTVTQGNDGVAYAQYTRANSEYLSSSSASLKVNALSNFSLNGWCYADSITTNQVIISKLGGDGTYVLKLDGSANFSFTIYSTDGAFSSNAVTASNFGALSTGGWHMWTITVNKSGNVSVKIDDGTANTTAYTITQSGGDTGEFDLGRSANSGDYWDGRQRRVGFWDKVLSGAEITQLYAGGSGLSYAAM